MEVVERKIKIGPSDALSLFGPGDQFLQLIEQKFDASILARGDTITARGTPGAARSAIRPTPRSGRD